MSELFFSKIKAFWKKKFNTYYDETRVDVLRLAFLGSRGETKLTFGDFEFDMNENQTTTVLPPSP